MKKELTSFETPEQILRDIVRNNRPQKGKKKRNRKMMETDIDIFAGCDHIQIRGTEDDTN